MQSSLGRHGVRARTAFTLVELLVVIGIIAVLIGVLLPALSKARARAQTVACLANLRSISQACVNYTVEYKGSYPFGFAFNKFKPADGRPAGADSSYITWFSSCDKYMKARETEIVLLDANSGFYDGATRRVFNAAFKCPAVDTGTFKQQVHYFNHGVVMPQMTLELPTMFRGTVPPLRGPAKVNQVYPDTALFWDTPVFSDAASVTPAMFWSGAGDHTSAGYAPFCTIIDDNEASPSAENGLLCHPELPERRFRGSTGDRFAGSTNPLKAPSGPIAWASDEFITSMNLGYTSGNIDFGGGTVWNIGNARFRHNGLGCNVAFVDGSVRTLYLNSRRTVSGSGASTYNDTEFRRYMLMIKWPSGTGIKDTLSYQTN
ncbi:MAG: prepilin-type N-terminal cleavage/methylation domain-containing protein [Anaerolineae bacterium]|nr:prepilin-type N-terminal cleavage/methylation domain-containing protein [Phycisphaerae bacterium]